MTTVAAASRSTGRRAPGVGRGAHGGAAFSLGHAPAGRRRGDGPSPRRRTCRRRPAASRRGSSERHTMARRRRIDLGLGVAPGPPARGSAAPTSRLGPSPRPAPPRALRPPPQRSGSGAALECRRASSGVRTAGSAAAGEGWARDLFNREHHRVPAVVLWAHDDEDVVRVAVLHAGRHVLGLSAAHLRAPALRHKKMRPRKCGAPPSEINHPSPLK